MGENSNEELLLIQKIKHSEEKTVELMKKSQEQSLQLIEHSKDVKNLIIQGNDHTLNIQKSVKELQELKIQVEDLQNNIQHLISIEETLNKNSETEHRQELETIPDTYNYFKKCFGIDIDLKRIDTQHFEVKIIFAENKYTTLNFNIDDRTFSLRDLQPLHPNFDNIKSYLDDTCDISGFLYFARNYCLKSST